jgi:16S rRNA (cytosine967-C5)-methyltransferase
MNEYELVLDILNLVLSGKNLSEVFNKVIDDNASKKIFDINIGRIKDISYGVLRHYFELNYILKKLCKHKPDSKVLIILIIGFYELLYTQKPPFAIVNDLVSFSHQQTKNSKFKGFINAVLRNFLRQKNQIKEQITENLECTYNFPQWFIKKLQMDYKNSWLQIITSLNQKPKISLRLNSIDRAKYIEYLQQANITYTIQDNTIILQNSIAIPKLPLFDEGKVSIQDINAQRLLKLAPLKNNQYILDACSAPGGKACQILENYDVELVALDVAPDRIIKLKQNLNRLNLDAKILCADASILSWWDKRLFDLIIADVPCSATGTIKHNPDIKLHRQLDDIQNFVITQRKIVLNLWQTLKPGGFLVYITCSIFKEENQDNIEFLIQHLANIKKVKEWIFLPDEYGDGFYYALLQKTI